MCGLETQNVPGLSSDRVGFVVMGDFHQSVVGDTTALTSVPFDQYVPTAIRPPAEILASGLMNRYALAVSRKFASTGWNEFLVGDYIDASRKKEWALFKSLQADGDIPFSAPGNHDGELLGSVLNTEDPHGAASLLISPSAEKEEAENALDDQAWMEDYLTARHQDQQISFVEVATPTHINPEDVQSFHQYWRQMSNGNFVCAIHRPNDNFSHGASFLVQARKVLDNLGGRSVYHIVLDTSDMSATLPPNAAVGMISELQKNLVLLFMNQMRETANEPLFILSGHVAPHEQDERNWERVGLDELYSQRDVLPVAFYANGHHRDITDETEGGRVSRVGPSLSVMTPAIVDAPNEFMTVDVAWEQSTQTYVVTQEYHPIFSGGAVFDDDVVAAVHQFDEQLAPQHYAAYSELSSRPLATATNIFFRKKVLARDADLVQLRSLREDITYVEKYYEFLTSDQTVNADFVSEVENHLNQLKAAAVDSTLVAPSPAMLEHAQALQRLISQTPFDSQAGQFMLLLAQVASKNEGVPGVRRGLKYDAPEAVPDQNIFRWNPATDVVTRE